MPSDGLKGSSAPAGGGQTKRGGGHGLVSGAGIERRGMGTQRGSKGTFFSEWQPAGLAPSRPKLPPEESSARGEAQRMAA